MVEIQPIFPEYTIFLKDSGCDVSWYKNRTYWLDRNIVKAFDDRGGCHPLFKITVDDKLNITLTKHKLYKDDFTPESWDETIQRMEPRIRELEAKSISLLKDHCSNPERQVINTNSTGKDSMVVQHLAEKAGLAFATYFNVTTLDVAESNIMAKRNGFHMTLPPSKYGGFYDYIKRYDYDKGGCK